MIKRCPNCDGVTRPSALRCSCGYDFETGQVSKVRVDRDVQVGIGEVYKPKKKGSFHTSVAKVFWILGLCLVGSPFLLGLLRLESDPDNIMGLLLLYAAFPLGVLFLFSALIYSIEAKVRRLWRKNE